MSFSNTLSDSTLALDQLHNVIQCQFTILIQKFDGALNFFKQTYRIHYLIPKYFDPTSKTRVVWV